MGEDRDPYGSERLPLWVTKTDNKYPEYNPLIPSKSWQRKL